MPPLLRNFYVESDWDAAERLDRLRQDAYRRGAEEARLFLSQAGSSFTYEDVRKRLDQIIAAGRSELEAKSIARQDIEAWDTACRIMFLLIAWRPL
jgi:hypothetical protein